MVTVILSFYKNWDMHGLIFETSIWLLAGSTRCSHHCWPPCATQCSQKYNSRIQRNLNRMGHTSPDKAPHSALTDCTPSTIQLLNTPAVRQLDCCSQGFYPHPGFTWNWAVANPDRYRLDRTLAEIFEKIQPGPLYIYIVTFCARAT